MFHRHRLALLTLLILTHPRPLRRRKLAGLLWPESDDARARNLLNQAVFVLRRGLGDGVITSTPFEVGFEAAGAYVDHHRLLRALEDGEAHDVRSLYAAPLLDGFFLDGAPEFDRIIDAHRASLHDRVLRSLRAEADRLERLGALEDAVTLRAEVVALDPLDEKACLALMRTCCRAGRRSAALRHGYAYFDRMARIYDLPPDPEVCRLINVLRTSADTSQSRVTPSEVQRSPARPTVRQASSR